MPYVPEFVDAIKKSTMRVPTARAWFGFVAITYLLLPGGQSAPAGRLPALTRGAVTG